MTKAVKSVTSIITGGDKPKMPAPAPVQQVPVPNKDMAGEAATEEIRKRRATSGQRSTILAGQSVQSLEGTMVGKKTLLGE